MSLKLSDLIKQGEHQQQDFKHCIDDQRKIARTMVAFTNTDGGRLLIGVKDNGKVTGINPEEEFHMIEGAASMFCRPAISFESKIWQEGFRYVLEIKVEASKNREYKAMDEDGKWKSFVRIKDHTILANKIILKIWSFERKGIQKPLQFGEKETQFLAVFKDGQQFSLSKVYRSLPFPKQQIDHLTALFVHWNVLRMEFSGDGFLYTLN